MLGRDGTFPSAIAPKSPTWSKVGVLEVTDHGTLQWTHPWTSSWLNVLSGRGAWLEVVTGVTWKGTLFSLLSASWLPQCKQLSPTRPYRHVFSDLESADHALHPLEP